MSSCRGHNQPRERPQTCWILAHQVGKYVRGPLKKSYCLVAALLTADLGDIFSVTTVDSVQALLLLVSSIPPPRTHNRAVSHRMRCGRMIVTCTSAQP